MATDSISVSLLDVVPVGDFIAQVLALAEEQCMTVEALQAELLDAVQVLSHRLNPVE